MEKYYREIHEAVFDLLAAVGKHDAVKNDKEVIKAFRELTKKRKVYLSQFKEIYKDGKRAKSPVAHHVTGPRAE